MSNELQTDEVSFVIETEEVADKTESGTGETGSELATDSAEEHDKTNQDGVQAAINKQHAKYREEERKRKEAEARIEEYEAKLKKYETPKMPDVPPIPDPYDDDYEAKMKVRDEALLEKAKYDADVQYKALQEQRQLEEAEQAKRAEVQRSIEGYEAKATELGLNKDDVNKAGQKLVDYGIRAEVAEFILADQDGPLITRYLAENPVEFDEINRMSAMMAAVTINSTIRAKASGLKPQPSRAPEPPEYIGGLGPGEQKDPLLEGVKFE